MSTQKPLEEQSGDGRYDWIATDAQGHIVLHTWTSSPVTFLVERLAYQDRLNRSDRIAQVQVIRRFDKRHPERQPAVWMMHAQVPKSADSRPCPATRR